MGEKGKPKANKAGTLSHEKPRFGKKVQPKEISDKQALRNKFMEHVQRWSKALGVDVKVDWKGEKQLSPEENIGMKDGVLYVRESAINEILETLNILVGHELGHELERMLNPKAGATTRGLKDVDAYTTPGFEDPKKRYSCPPFGATIFHARDLRRVFDREYTVSDSTGRVVRRNYLQDIGYNARQIFADSAPVKTIMRRRGGRKFRVRMGDLMSEWITLLDRQYQSLSDEIRGEKYKIRWLGHIPALARFTASAWALRKIAGAWVKDPQRAQEMQGRLEGFTKKFGKLLTEPEVATGTELTEEQAYQLLEIPAAEHHGPKPSREPRKSGLSQEELTAVAVLTRAYKEHFINCMSQKELFEDERIEPHLKKLNSPVEHIRRMEAYTLSEIGSLRALDPLIDKVNDVNESQTVRNVAIPSILEILRKNRTDKRVLKYMPLMVSWFDNPDPEVRYNTSRIWLRVAKTHGRSRDVLDSLSNVVKLINNPDPNIRFQSLHVCLRVARAHRGAREVLSILPDVVKRFSDPEGRVRGSALFLWGDIARGHPGAREILDSLPEVIKYFDDPSSFIRYHALDAWWGAAYANPNEPIILRTKTAYEAAKKKFRK